MRTLCFGISFGVTHVTRPGGELKSSNDVPRSNQKDNQSTLHQGDETDATMGPFLRGCSWSVSRCSRRFTFITSSVLYKSLG